MQINGRTLNVEVSGPEKGPTVILLHHGLGSTRAWKEQVPSLTEAGFRVVAYDRWGCGNSEPRPILDVPQFASDQADLDTLLKELGGGPVTLVGHSDGGTIALAYTANHPQRVAAVVAVAAHVFVEPKMAVGIMGVRGNFRTNERFRAALERVHGEKVESVFKNWFNGWIQVENLTWDLRPQLGRIRCPVWIVQGTEDEHATPEHARAIAAAIPGARLWLLEGAAHMLPQEHSTLFNSRLILFLQQVIQP